MTVLSARSIREKVVECDMIFPFHPCRMLDGPTNLSFGLGPASYDVRVEFDGSGSIPEVVIAPGGFRLAATIERFQIPLDILMVAHDKSTWARRGLTVQNTVADPGWNGHLTLELTNHSSDRIILSRGTPIAQVVFHQLDRRTSGYSGKYQDQQRGPVEPR